MSDPNQPGGGSSIPAGWYPDGQGGQRWWDGSQWTAHTQPAGGSSTPPAAPQAPQTPLAPGAPGGDLPTQIAPNRASGYPQQPQQPPASAPPQQPYGAPAGQQPYGGAPQQQPYGAPAGQSPYGAPGGYPGASSSGGGKSKLLILIGGGVAAVIVLIILLVVAFKVIGGGSPEDVASDYLGALADGDVEKACELSSEDLQEADFEFYEVDNCSDYAEEIENSDDGEFDLEEYQDDFDVDYEIDDVTEKEKTAEVDYTATFDYKGDDEYLEDLYGDGEETDGTISLVKEDGDWKVDGDTGAF